MRRAFKTVLMGGIFITGVFLVFYFLVPILFSVTYRSSHEGDVLNDVKGAGTTESLLIPLVPPEIIVTHLPTPEPLRAVYMTACYASQSSLRNQLVALIEKTELNAVIIDIKDYTGTISYEPSDKTLNGDWGSGCRVRDMKAFVAELHKKNIYVIGRLTVFQDPTYTKVYPELAVKRASDGGVWKDYKGLSFIDVSATPYWDYVVALALDAHAQGFDEINFDYIRFPSDGNMRDIAYPWSKNLTKRQALENFFAYLEEKVKPSGVIISADLFGMTATNTDDLNIGQVLEPALRHFDYVSPMVYPSHYPPNYNGWKDPNQHAYDVVHYSMSSAVARAVSASTTPLKLRPWLQDFDYGGIYGTKEVRDQIQATYDAGLTSWMLWDPSNKYTPSALQPAE